MELVEVTGMETGMEMEGVVDLEMVTDLETEAVLEVETVTEMGNAMETAIGMKEMGMEMATQIFLILACIYFYNANILN